jgi:response regulator RpfG family c-di-GMP phosphodiesterase
MAKDILIVDDIKSSLSNYGNDVRLNLGIEPFLADNPNKALDILKYYPIKVLVTDQEMPEILGTELIKKVKKDLGLNIPCIMLTGHTDKVSITDAVNLGFFRFIDKKNVHHELVPAIKSAIQQYDFERLRDSTVTVNKIIHDKKKFLSSKNHSTVKLIRISSIIDTFVDENDWSTEHIAERNISQQFEKIITKRVKTLRESGIESALCSKLNIKSSSLLSSLQSTLEGKITVNSKIIDEEEITYSVKHTIDIKEITDTKSTEGLTLASREYQSAPVYKRLNFIIETDCSFCNMKKQFDLSLDVITNRIALRHKEHYNTGQPNIVYTGFRNFDFDDLEK